MQLDLRIVVPGPDAETVLVDGQGSLPGAAVDGDQDEAAIYTMTDGGDHFLRRIDGAPRVALTSAD